MKTAIFALVLLIFQFSAQAQNKDSAHILADITGGERISLPDSYVFERSLDLTFSSGPKANLTSLQYKFRSPESEAYLAMTISDLAEGNTQKNPEMVVDFETERIINFMCFSHTKMALIHTLTEPKKDIRISKTDYSGLKPTEKSKSILGYNCKAYRFSNDSFKGIVWIASEIAAGLDVLFTELGLSIALDEGHTGYILLMESEKKDTGELTNIAVNQVNTDDVYAIDSQNYVATAVPSN